MRSDPMEPAPLRLVEAFAGRYAVRGVLGRGGMATVYLAEDARHGRRVALKVLDPELGTAVFADRFVREVEVTARLDHPHILPLLDSGEADGFLYYVMPYVEGESLKDRLERETQLPVEDALRIAREVADALGYAHAHGVVHRDIKPGNILLSAGHARVADFGIAKAIAAADRDRLTATGVTLGTVAYMSPEQVAGTVEVDGRSDLYSLGCVLFEMLAGQPPFIAPSPASVASQHLAAPAPAITSLRPSVPPAVAATIARALAKAPADRFGTAAELVAALGDATPARTAPPRSHLQRWWFAAAALIVAAAATVATLVSLRDARTPGEAPARIAVLPFVDVGEADRQGYFADGLTEELITTLSRVDGLSVVARTSAFALRGHELDVREVGRRLGAESVIEGSVRRSDRRLRITARLVSVTDGTQRWADTYDREVEDVLAIQEEIAQAIVAQLKGRLGAGDRAAVRRAPVVPEAYDLFLRGRYFWHQRTERDLRRAVDAFAEAIALAPDFASAHLGLADAYAVLGFYDYLPPSDAFPPAARAARRALELDPSLGAAHATLGYVALYHDWDWDRAEREFLRAIELAPDYSTAHQWYANLLTAMGRFDEAERAMRRAQVLDPLSIIASAALGWVHYYAGDYERAVAQCRAALVLNPAFELAHLWAGQALEMLGQSDEAVAALRRAVELSGEGAIFAAALARTLALRAERAEAERRLARIEAGRHVPAYEIARVHTALGRRDDALAWLERAYGERSHAMAFLRVDPQLAALRDEPRFRELLARMRL
jgi:TolB-like protein/Tfp pilus assembly protein PilF/tRNA A-37 threonylcarbamoyl transferase component Bud32